MKKEGSKRKLNFKARSKIRGTPDRPRLSVFRSNKYIYAQIIDDTSGKTLVQASDIKIKDKIVKTKRAEGVGLEVAKEAKKKNIPKVFFDRNGYKYHGRVKQLAEAARKGGLNF